TFPLLEGTNIDNQGNRTTVWFIITDISDMKLARSFKGMGLSYAGLLKKTPPAALSSATWTGNIINRYPRIPLVGGEWTFNGDLPNPIPSASNPTPFQDPNNDYSPLRSVTIGVPVVVNTIFVKWGDADFEQLRVVPGGPYMGGQVLEIDTEFPSPSVTFKLHKSWFMDDYTPYYIATDAYPEGPANDLGVPFVPKNAKLGEMALPLYQSLSPDLNPNNLPGRGFLGGQIGVVPYFRPGAERRPGDDFTPMWNIGFISWNIPQPEILRFVQDVETLWLAGFLNVYKFPPGSKIPFSPIDQSPSLVVNCPIPLTLDIDDFRDDFGPPDEDNDSFCFRPHPSGGEDDEINDDDEDNNDSNGFRIDKDDIGDLLPPNADLLNGGAITIRDNQGNFIAEFCIGNDGDVETALAMLEVEELTVPLVFPRPLFVCDVGPADYQVAARLEAGSVYYIDSPHKVTSLPTGMEELIWIKTANRDKDETIQDFLYFATTRAVIVYVAYDSRASSLPNWLVTFTNTGTSIGTTDGALNVYAKFFPLGPTGQILLGGNKALGASGDNSNYIVALRPLFGSEDSIEDFLITAERIRLLPLFQLLKSNSQGFKRTVETINTRLGKRLVHENLFIALIASIRDLSKVSIEPPGTLMSLSAGTLVTLSEEDIVFTKGILQDLEKIVNPTSTDLSQK
ncbi:MAG: hypothetical protein V3W19_10870, partial [Desulfatiglandales bacterium]